MFSPVVYWATAIIDYHCSTIDIVVLKKKISVPIQQYLKYFCPHYWQYCRNIRTTLDAVKCRNGPFVYCIAVSAVSNWSDLFLWTLRFDSVNLPPVGQTYFYKIFFWRPKSFQTSCLNGLYSSKLALGIVQILLLAYILKTGRVSHHKCVTNSYSFMLSNTRTTVSM